MSLRVDADAYWRFIGRYSEKLAAGFADYAGVEHGQTALDVGCGPGGLTAVLVERLGSAHVAALDPGEPFVEAARTRLPGGDIGSPRPRASRSMMKRACEQSLPSAPFTVSASAWTASGIV